MKGVPQYATANPGVSRKWSEVNESRCEQGQGHGPDTALTKVTIAKEGEKRTGMQTGPQSVCGIIS